MRCATKNGTTQNWIESNNLRVWIIGGDCLKSQIFLSENRESAFGLVQGYGVFQSREDFSVSLRGINKSSSDDRPGPGNCGSKYVEDAKAARSVFIRASSDAGRRTAKR